MSLLMHLIEDGIHCTLIVLTFLCTIVQTALDWSIDHVQKAMLRLRSLQVSFVFLIVIAVVADLRLPIGT